MEQGAAKTDWGCLLGAIVALLAGAWAADALNSDDPVAIETSPVERESASLTQPVNEFAEAPPPAPPPEPNFDFVEDGTYGYIAGISEEDRKRGKAAGNVYLFRYVGTHDGKHRLEHVTSDGAIVAVSECSKPCVGIRIYHNGSSERLAFNPGSVIGAAFDDALSGRLKRFVRPPAPRLTPPTNPEPVAAAPITQSMEEELVENTSERLD